VSEPQITHDIAQLEQEIDLLRRRHAIMQRTNLVARICLMLIVPALAIVAAGVTVYAFVADVVVGLFIVGMAAVIAVAVWIGRGAQRTLIRATRPSRFLPVGLVSHLGWWRPRDEKSELDTIQDMIALRERRLADLKRASAS
jgi:hypothetical protein